MNMTPEEVKDIVTGFAADVLRSLGFEANIQVESCSNDEISLMISGPDTSFIIGDDGSRLDDLQYLLNRFVVLHSQKSPRIRVDCDHYRQQQEQRVVDAAIRKARHVLKTGRPCTLKPLNAYFRRLVHTSLSEMPGISTQSEEGDARFKRITISRQS